MGTPSALAATSTGWTGSTGNVGGTLYLHNSSITNSPAVRADSSAWTVFGELIVPGNVGILTRLFKSGVLCEAQGYFYITAPANTYTLSTSGADCGPGSYNSHGLQKFWDGSKYVDAITFPSSPLDFPAPAGRAAEEAPAPFVNERGERGGSAEGIESDAELPDLIAAYGTNNEVGYVKKTDLVSGPVSKDQALALPTTTSGATEGHHEPSRTVPLYGEDGVTVLGEFRIL